jgi:hypothetical protein
VIFCGLDEGAVLHGCLEQGIERRCPEGIGSEPVLPGLGGAVVPRAACLDEADLLR